MILTIAGMRGEVLADLPEIVAGLVLCLVWCVTEYLGRTSTWAQGAPKTPPKGLDKGTYPAIALALSTSLLVSAATFLLGLGPSLPLPWPLLGLAVGIGGLGLRLWAMRTLGKFFTMPITLAADHRIVQNGPYHWLRHPSYTGNFLAAFGMSLLLGTLLGIAVTLVLCLGIYVHRIRIEEATLLSRFGPAYAEYRTRTSALLPMIF